jgi:hypothetical protein
MIARSMRIDQSIEVCRIVWSVVEYARADAPIV